LDLGYTFDALAQVEIAMQQPDLAEQHFLKAIKIFIDAGYQYFEAVSKRNLAGLYRARDQIDRAVEPESDAERILAALTFSN